MRLMADLRAITCARAPGLAWQAQSVLIADTQYPTTTELCRVSLTDCRPCSSSSSRLLRTAANSANGNRGHQELTLPQRGRQEGLEGGRVALAPRRQEPQAVSAALHSTTDTLGVVGALPAGSYARSLHSTPEAFVSCPPDEPQGRKSEGF